MADSGGWNTIESDAGVFTYLLDELGAKNVQFEELLSLDSEFLYQLHPVYGVIFLFKVPLDKPYRVPDGQKPVDGDFDYPAGERIFFAAQTIQNACGTQALLSVLLNRTESSDDGVPALEIGEKLKEFRSFAMALPPDFRGEVLSNSELIRTVHNSFARSNPFADETNRPPPMHPDEAEAAFHFVAYVPVAGKLYELDGLQPAPISHGPCTQSEFPEMVMDVLRRRVERYDAAEVRFNLLAVTRDLRLRAQELGDREMLVREEKRRRAWRYENVLRRHNFVGFAGEVLKGVVAAKLREGQSADGDPEGEKAYQRWVEQGKEKMKKRIEDRRRQIALTTGQEVGTDVDVDMGG